MTVNNRHIFYPTNVPVNLPAASTNWIAVEVHLSSVSAVTMGFDMELIGSGFLLPSLSIERAGDNNATLSWPLSYGSSFSLYSATNLGDNSWTPELTFIQTNNGRLTTTQSLDSSAKFFRLQGIYPASP